MPYVSVLAVGSEGNRLVLALDRDEAEADWFHARLSVEAHPWHGVLETIFTRDELLAFGQALRVERLPRKVALGGGRAAELLLDLKVQQGQNAGRIAMVAELTPSGDDPYPFVRWLMFDVPSDFGPAEAGAIEAFVDGPIRSSAPPST